MTKEEYRKHCEKQIERCIKLRDTKHLREHELSLALLNECEDRKQKEDNLIKYLKVKIKECEDRLERLEDTESHIISVLNGRIYSYQDILKRLKSGNNE